MDTTDLFHAAATLSSKTSLKKKSSGPLQMKPKAVMVDTGQIIVFQHTSEVHTSKSHALL